MSNWAIYIEASGSTWEADGGIPRPNETMETQVLSNTTRIKLANGASAYFTPTTKSYKEEFSMTMLELDDTVVSKIDDYIENNTKVKIVTHTSEVFIGKFLSRQRAWLTGIEPDVYDLIVRFQCYE